MPAAEAAKGAPPDRQAWEAGRGQPAGSLHRHHLLLGDALVHLAHLQAHNGLEQAGAVVGAGEGGVLEHLLRDLAVELGRGVGQVALHVDELLQLVELAVHLQHRHLLAVVSVGAVEHLDAGEGAGQLAAAGDPGHGGALVKQVDRVEQLLAVLHDQAHAQDLALLLVGHQLGGQHLDDDVSLLLLGVNVGVEVGLACLNGLLD
uniref:Uncharacterized protein n=2 Tax=Noccaea caerulescens TaxID=107243 RepID=A0A1J3DGT8_NOCCA